MSELKADKTFVFGEECEAYKKSEADKVIAEKDKERIMAKITYNGMELEEFTSDKPVIFDPPKKMVVTDDYDCKCLRVTEIIVYDPRRTVCKAIGIHNQSWRYCFLLPDPPKPRRATWLEVARWCATGKGLVYDSDRDKIDTGIMFKPSNESESIVDEIKVRKWSDTEWHEPDVDYLFGGNDADR